MQPTVFEDNNGAMGLDESPRKTLGTNQIAAEYHLFREYVGKVTWIIIQRM